MITNLIKKYPQLLEIDHLNEKERRINLRKIFERDIETNDNFKFREKIIRPLKFEDQIKVDTLFEHLITEKIKIKETTGRMYEKRVYECDRAKRLHWIREHIDLEIRDEIDVFSTIERDQKKKNKCKKNLLVQQKNEIYYSV